MSNGEGAGKTRPLLRARHHGRVREVRPKGCCDSRLLDDSVRAVVRPDPVQVIGGKLSLRLLTSDGVAQCRFAFLPGAVIVGTMVTGSVVHALEFPPTSAARPGQVRLPNPRPMPPVHLPREDHLLAESTATSGGGQEGAWIPVDLRLRPSASRPTRCPMYPDARPAVQDA